ncbi:MAG: tRNA pseudouridine synthase A [Saprospirales bacterium]|nr:tRNA pseudouridine synthase A [Saprospirales bacterium]MBK8924161.1 tRNA pseudouridine synthase A [Saprospirales bacterium]
MRYFLTLAYRGTRYAGWQRQPNACSVQEVLETALATLLREPVGVTGCGRTDTGVHARYYVAHFDTGAALPVTFLSGLNSLLPDDIAVYAVRPVQPEAHARYDAVARSYEYHITLRKDPFAAETAWFYPQGRRLHPGRLAAVAALLPEYGVFFPFCKTHSGVAHYACALTAARWELDSANEKWVFYISANRFLRGMVRLIVGACVLHARDQIGLDEIREALDVQRPLRKTLSVPARGLLLAAVEYPYPV